MWTRIVNYFIPVALREDLDAYRQARIIISVCLIVAIMNTLYIGSAKTTPSQIDDYVLTGNAIFSLLSAFLLKWGAHPVVCANVFQVDQAAGIFLLMWYGGGTSSPSTSGVILLPAVSLLMAGKRSSLVWMGIVYVFMAVLYYYETHYRLPPIYFSADRYAYMFFSGLLGILTAMFVVALVFHQEKNHALRRLQQKNTELTAEKRRSDSLLLNILPEEVAEELKRDGQATARAYGDVTVLFTDFVDFTKMTAVMSPREVVDLVHIYYSAFDQILERHGIEKIKTIGDAYMAAAGVPTPMADHAARAAQAAIEILEFARRRYAERPEKSFQIRIGMHSGPVVSGVVGLKKFSFDIWGDTVNIAARMEQASLPGHINLSETTHACFDGRFECAFRGELEAKNKGLMKMYFLTAQN
jgi:class 3 adenylate cyclase